MPRRRERIRDMVANGMDSVQATALVISEAIDGFCEHGVEIKFKSVMGIAIPESILHIRLARPGESEESDEE